MMMMMMSSYLAWANGKPGRLALLSELSCSGSRVTVAHACISIHDPSYPRASYVARVGFSRRTRAIESAESSSKRV
jgi:hypothetical protein